MIEPKVIDELIKDLEKYKTTLSDITFAEKYLNYYGYVDTEVKHKDEFQIALKKFQDLYAIQSDGELGPETIKAMSTPRCAVKDFMTMREFASWRKDHLTYYINGYVSGLDKSTQEQIIKKAWNQWEDVTDIHIEKSSTPSADIIIGVGQGSRDDFDGPSGTLAWAELPSGKDRQLIMKFDLGETWIDNPRNRGILMLNVACHEFGHLLGLEHSRQSSALMAPFYSPNVSKPQNNDDIPRIQQYYGKPVTPTVPPVDNTPNPTPVPLPTPNAGSKLIIDLEGTFNIKNITIPGYRLVKLD